MAKGLFLYRGDSIYRDRPFEFYRFPSQYLSRAKQFVGDWVVYMEPVKAGRRGYHAVAKLKKIVPDPEQPGMWLALIDEGSYVPLGKDVPFRSAGEVVEKACSTAMEKSQAALGPRFARYQTVISTAFFGLVWWRSKSCFLESAQSRRPAYCMKTTRRGKVRSIVKPS